MLSMVASVHNVDKPILQSIFAKSEYVQNALAVRKFSLPNFGNFLNKSSGMVKSSIFLSGQGLGKVAPNRVRV